MREDGARSEAGSRAKGLRQDANEAGEILARHLGRGARWLGELSRSSPA
jgi:hypothetical protein